MISTLSAPSKRKDAVKLEITCAIKRFKLDVKKEPFVINAELFGENIDINKHGFKVEIKSPTFHEMNIHEGKEIIFKYLLDL